MAQTETDLPRERMVMIECPTGHLHVGDVAGRLRQAWRETVGVLANEVRKLREEVARC